MRPHRAPVLASLLVLFDLACAAGTAAPPEIVELTPPRTFEAPRPPRLPSLESRCTQPVDDPACYCLIENGMRRCEPDPEGGVIPVE
jgi:hypothetical protein